ncbi:site-specific integrase [Suttonella ornithocola]|uniref:Site-specific recombinase XerD n=1 Tax=Suttonella ornithocola TaxID=279832 RepID=A0A380RAV6_9GAMM|nr:site-specific integrase [Suttonella ornithocola]SUO95299.1 Site-specific recombinase XerD [Suttonella ornithocola]SUQ09753.1 Site-specific recombinase XerD [Suttonella ornithocola]
MSIVTRKDKKGNIRYRVQIRKNISGFPKFSESKTFSSKATAIAWERKRLLEIEENPEIMLGVRKSSLSLGAAIERFLEENGKNYARSVNFGLRSIARMPIADIPISSLSRSLISEFARQRRAGDIDGFEHPVAASTVKADLSLIRMVLTAADLSWNIDVDLAEFDRALNGLSKTRMIEASGVRDVLPSYEDFEHLMAFFAHQWKYGRSLIPMHLIVWLAVYSTRRRGELVRLRLSDFNRSAQSWLVRDVKSPHGAKGNNKVAHITNSALQIIDLLLESKVRERMLIAGGDESLLLPVNAASIGTNFSRAIQSFKGNFCFHSLRHEGITRLAEDGYSIPQIQRVSLHSSWSSLQRYDNAVKREGKRAEWTDFAHLFDR